MAQLLKLYSRLCTAKLAKFKFLNFLLISRTQYGRAALPDCGKNILQASASSFEDLFRTLLATCYSRYFLVRTEN